MKKILYTLLAGAVALGSCSKSNDMPTAPQDEATTFTLAVDAAATRATSAVTPDRYIMEVWSEDGTTAENVFGTGDAATNHAQITSGNAFTVTLDKTKAYTCLFWADDNYAFNAASLKAIRRSKYTESAEAYFSKVVVAKGKNPSVAVILKRAVAKITLTETATVKTTDRINLTLSNIYSTFNVQAGEASGTATELYWPIYPTATTGIIGTLYVFAKTDKELSDLEFKCEAAPWNTVSNIPIQQNFATNIKGDYSQRSSFIFTVTADDEWNTPSNDEELGVKISVGDYYYKDKTIWPIYTEDAANPCIGIVYVVNSDGKTGKIVSLDEVEAAWSTENIVTGATSHTDGAANTAKVLALGSYTAEKYPAFAWCAAQNTTAPAGISWYLPAINECPAFLNAATRSIVNNSLRPLRSTSTDLSSSGYLSSTEYEDDSMYTYGGITDKHYDLHSVRAISAF